MENPKFQVFKGTNQQFYFHLKARNGEKVLSGEGYTAKQSCLNGIASVKVNAPYDSRYEHRDQLYNYTFNLKAGNGEIIGRSEGYTSICLRSDRHIEKI